MNLLVFALNLFSKLICGDLFVRLITWSSIMRQLRLRGPQVLNISINLVIFIDFKEYRVLINP